MNSQLGEPLEIYKTRANDDGARRPGHLILRQTLGTMKPRTQLAELIMGAGLVGGSARKKSEVGVTRPPLRQGPAPSSQAGCPSPPDTPSPRSPQQDTPVDDKPVLYGFAPQAERHSRCGAIPCMAPCHAYGPFLLLHGGAIHVGYMWPDTARTDLGRSSSL